MKSFNDFKKSVSSNKKDITPDVNIVPDYSSTFQELRPKQKKNKAQPVKKTSDVKESFMILEAKGDKKGGITDKDFEERTSRPDPDKPANDYWNPEFKYHALHDRDDVKPRGLTAEHRIALRHYTQTGSEDPHGHKSSGNINAHLRGTPIIGGHKPEDVQKAADSLNAVFTKKNTNKIPLNMYSGVPRHVGESLMKGAKDFAENKPELGAKHKFSGFTSTSSNFDTALEFAKSYHSNGDRNKDKSELVHHMIHFHAKPGTVLSVVHHSQFSENEGVMQPNTFTHLGYEKHKAADGSTIIIHHMTHAD